ncbi:MAG: HigA family addiction module antitoxin [Bacteroidales bacterium]|nr:HigA family addiction module antitoxin [Bacteroidales bacterium]
MATSKEIQATPFAVAHPTEIIKDELKARGLTQRELAQRMDMQTSNLSRFLKGESITPAIAAKLEVALDIPAEFWLNLQAQYEIDSRNIAVRDEQEQAAINVEKMLSNIINLPELYKRLGINPSLFIQQKLDILKELLGFPVLEISSQSFALQSCFKKNEKQGIDERNETTWLTLAFIDARKNRPSETFKQENAQTAARQVAEAAHANQLSEAGIKHILDANGIAYCVVPKLEKTPIDAASMMVEGYPAVITTHRYNDMSRLIFNVLHELGHIFMHMNQVNAPVFVSSEYSYSRENKEEKEANEFAENTLIPQETWRKMMAAKTISLSKQSILRTLKQLSDNYKFDFNLVVWRYKHEFNQYDLYSAKAQKIV